MTTTTEHVPAGTVLQVDPADLVLDDNIRADPRLDDAFVESIRTNGVMVPLQVRRDPLGQLLIIDGQRRHIAASLAELHTVPVIVVAGVGDDGDRITNQWILNEHRAGLTSAERVAAIEQLALFGRSPSSIAKKLGASEAEVDAARAVAQAPEVLAAAPAVDLVVAAKLVEFADDADLVEGLAAVSTDDPDYFEHRIEEARQDRAVERAKAERLAQLADAGVQVVARGTGDLLARLSAKPSDGTSYGEPLTAKEHATCPHRAVWVDAFWDRDAPGIDVDEVCLDRQAAGHFNRYDLEAGVDQEAAAAAKSAERKRVIAQNAAADAAQEVRRRFITDQLLWERDPKGRMVKVPDGVVQHLAVVISTQGSALGLEYESRTLLNEWESGKSLPAPGSTRTSAERALLRRVLAMGETGLPRTFWRSHHYAGNYSLSAGQAPIGVLHLRRLEAWGYGLASIEREYLEAWDAAVTKHNEAEARRAAERAERDAEKVTA